MMLLDGTRALKDGIYNVEGIDFIELKDDDSMYIEGNTQLPTPLPKECEEFIIKYPEYVYGSAYGTPHTFILAKQPDKFTGKVYGSWFNYGSTNLLTNCPKAILILAEDD